MKNYMPILDNFKSNEYIEQNSNISSEIPRHKSWGEYKDLYLKLKREQIKWLKIEDEICKHVEYLCHGNFHKQMTLNRCLPVTNKGRYLIKNILTSRRIIFFQIVFCQGRLHEVETFLGYEEEENISYENPYFLYHSAFRKYCCQLAIKPTAFRETGEGLLLEEKEWLIKKCFLHDLLYGFPILP